MVPHIGATSSIAKMQAMINSTNLARLERLVAWIHFEQAREAL
jgi:hypothetical protein